MTLHEYVQQLSVEEFADYLAQVAYRAMTNPVDESEETIRNAFLSTLQSELEDEGE